MSSTTNPLGDNTIPVSAPSLPVTPRISTSEKEETRFSHAAPTFRQQWIDAFKHIWPVYLASHIAFFLLTYLSVLFSTSNFSSKSWRISALLEAWNRWDTGHFTFIADHGYDGDFRTAFFPLYPLLEHGLSYIVQTSFVAGLIIANIAALFLFMVLYRLIADDFGPNTAKRTILYFAIFPSTFFLVSAYNESLFIFLTLLSFYYMRRSKWWIAGLIGFFASLTRSAGLLLVIPFCYEYLRQHNFQLRKVRGDSASIVLIPAGVGTFAVYCYEQFHDLLAFAHAQANWGRVLVFPSMTFVYAWNIIQYNPILSFFSIHTIIDLSTTLFMLILVVCCFIGPWKFAREHWSYALYTVIFYLFLISFPAIQFPVQSLTRQMTEIFPAFIILARWGKYAQFQLYYLSIAGSLLCFLLLQFLAGYWVV